MSRLDGSARLLPTPGHSPGHASILLDAGDHDILFVGDNAYTLRHLAAAEVRQMTIGGAATESQVDAIRRTQRLLGDPPGTVTLYAHDHTRYQSGLVEPFLADGVLSAEERRRIEGYERSVFARDWGLRPGNAPHFSPPKGGEGTGSVAFR